MWMSNGPQLSRQMLRVMICRRLREPGRLSCRVPTRQLQGDVPPFFNGVTILMLSMLGEYIVRTLNQTSSREPYHITEIVSDDMGVREDWHH